MPAAIYVCFYKIKITSLNLPLLYLVASSTKSTMTIFLPSVFFPTDAVVDSFRLLFGSIDASNESRTDDSVKCTLTVNENRQVRKTIEPPFPQCSTKVSIHVCASCRHARAQRDFSQTQWHKKVRRCVLCIELGPIVQAHVAGKCAYCNKIVAPLTREHIVPKSHGGTFRPRICCARCNQKRGTSLDFMPYKLLIAGYPILQAYAQSQILVFKNQSLTSLQQTGIKDILHTSSNTNESRLKIMHFPNKAI